MKKFTLHLLLLATFQTCSVYGAQAELDSKKSDQQRAANNRLRNGRIWPGNLEIVETALQDNADASIFFPTGPHYGSETWQYGILRNSPPEIALAIAKKIPLEYLIEALDATRYMEEKDTCFSIKNTLIELLATRNISERFPLGKKDQLKANHLLERAVNTNNYRLAQKALDSGANVFLCPYYWYGEKHCDKGPLCEEHSGHSLLVVATVIEICDKEIIALLASTCPPHMIKETITALEERNIADKAAKLAILQALVHTV